MLSRMHRKKREETIGHPFPGKYTWERQIYPNVLVGLSTFPPKKSNLQLHRGSKIEAMHCKNDRFVSLAILVFSELKVNKSF